MKQNTGRSPTGDPWQLPDGVDELLPIAAWRVEHLRRRIMDCCHAWGFELVMPPLIEYLDSLLTGTGETMDLQTFKLIDQQNGRTLGVRADMTPQVARIDAHALRSDAPNRLFYTGTVLRARTDGFGGSRSPQQFGAEIFGHAGPESDIEIIRLMLETVGLAGVPTNTLLLDLGHVGVYRGLVEDAGLQPEQEQVLFAALQRGSNPDAEALLDSLSTSSAAVQRLGLLLHLRGDQSVLESARAQLAGANDSVHQAIDTLTEIIAALDSTVRVHVDLAELRGYRYHTGMLFSAYTSEGEELARGGRYDAIGAAFGHARAATGFSGDLKQLADIATADRPPESSGIFVQADQDDDPWASICALRTRGERVVTGLQGSSLTAQIARCDRELLYQDGEWSVQLCR
jgi:ATP phosphoribosyltransferase regulatory subunit